MQCLIPPWLPPLMQSMTKATNLDEAVVAACALGARAAGNYGCVDSFLVQASHSANDNNVAMMMNQGMVVENDEEQGGELR